MQYTYYNIYETNKKKKNHTAIDRIYCEGILLSLSWKSLLVNNLKLNSITNH